MMQTAHSPHNRNDDMGDIHTHLHECVGSACSVKKTILQPGVGQEKFLVMAVAVRCFHEQKDKDVDEKRQHQLGVLCVPIAMANMDMSLPKKIIILGDRIKIVITDTTNVRVVCVVCVGGQGGAGGGHRWHRQTNMSFRSLNSTSRRFCFNLQRSKITSLVSSRNDG